MTHESSHRFSDLRVLLLGPKHSWKSSAGNTILGKNVFDLKPTLRCASECGEVSGCKLTVVDTPGWWRSSPLENPELYKQQVIRSLTRCAPGPHAVLLVLDVDTSFKHQENVVFENMRCFGEEVWRHTMVLFTCVDGLGAETADWFKDSEAATLHRLFKKCANRYHVLNVENRSDGSQVAELLEKIQKMVDGNQGTHYEIDGETLHCVEEKSRAQENKAEKRKKNLKITTGNKPHLTELNIVLLGYNGAGKSSTGNTILGKAAFDLQRSMTSVIREGEVSGRHITVVDTPDRRRNYCSKYTPRLYKDEIMLSSLHCSPGPHVFLLVIRADVAFPEIYRRAVDEHASSLGHRIWDHMIVIFTFGDWLAETSIEQFIEGEGEALRWIIEKCGNRYHVLNNQDNEDASQVTQLFEKIEEMVAGSREKIYQIDTEKLKEVQKRRMEAEKRAKQIKDKVQERNVRRSMSGYAECLEMRLVLFGPYCSGKTSTGNTILGREAFHKRRAAPILTKSGKVSGRNLTVVYTPGFEKGYNLKTLEDAKLNILRGVKECSSGTHAFIVTLCVDDSFAEEGKSAIEKILEPLGERVWNHTLVLFTVVEQLGNIPVELFIASEGDALQKLIEKCGNRYHVLNIKNWGDRSQVTELLEKIKEMVAENRGAYQMDRGILEEMERRVTVPIKKSLSTGELFYSAKESSLSSGIGSECMSRQSKDIPIEFRTSAKESSPSSGIGSECMSRQSKDIPIEFRTSKSLTSKLSSGVKSLGLSDTDFDTGL